MLLLIHHPGAGAACILRKTTCLPYPLVYGCWRGEPSPTSTSPRGNNCQIKQILARENQTLPSSRFKCPLPAIRCFQMYYPDQAWWCGLWGIIVGHLLPEQRLHIWKTESRLTSFFNCVTFPRNQPMLGSLLSQLIWFEHGSKRCDPYQEIENWMCAWSYQI